MLLPVLLVKASTAREKRQYSETLISALDYGHLTQNQIIFTVHYGKFNQFPTIYTKNYFKLRNRPWPSVRPFATIVQRRDLLGRKKAPVS